MMKINYKLQKVEGDNVEIIAEAVFTEVILVEAKFLNNNRKTKLDHLHKWLKRAVREQIEYEAYRIV